MTHGELGDRRKETTLARQEAGAQNVHLEGMRADEAPGSVPARSLAMEKRKRELEERKKQLEARKRKKTGGGGETAPESLASSIKAVTPAVAVAADPLPALDAQGAMRKGAYTKKDQPRAPPNPADAFLAQLEQDMLKR